MQSLPILTTCHDIGKKNINFVSYLAFPIFTLYNKGCARFYLHTNLVSRSTRLKQKYICLQIFKLLSVKLF